MTKHLNLTGELQASSLVMRWMNRRICWEKKKKKIPMKLWHIALKSILKQQQEHPNNVCWVSVWLDIIPSRCSFKYPVWAKSPNIGQKWPIIVHPNQNGWLHVSGMGYIDFVGLCAPVFLYLCATVTIVFYILYFLRMQNYTAKNTYFLLKTTVFFFLVWCCIVDWFWSHSWHFRQFFFSIGHILL